VELIEKESDIDSLREEIKYLKKHIRKENLKPGLVQAPDEEKNKLRTKLLQSKPTIKDANSTHGHLKYDEKGAVTEKGVRFTDRSILGTNFNVRIIGVRIWADKATFVLCGMQCIYRVGRNRKMGGEYLKGAKSQYT
jgi:hypothetical protein